MRIYLEGLWGVWAVRRLPVGFARDLLYYPPVMERLEERFGQGSLIHSVIIGRVWGYPSLMEVKYFTSQLEGIPPVVGNASNVSVICAWVPWEGADRLLGRRDFPRWP